MRDAATGDRSVAVVFAGWLNVNIPRQGATAREFLVDPLHADVVVFGTFVPRNYDHRRQPDCADGGGDCLLANVAALRPIRTALAPMLSFRELQKTFRATPHFATIEAEYLRRFKAAGNNWPNIAGTSIFAPLLGSKALSVLREIHGYSEGLKLLEAQESARRRRYDRVVWSRVEYNWLAPHPPLSLMPECYVWVPRPQFGMAIDDGHAVLSRAAADTYFRRWEYLLWPGMLARAPLRFWATQPPEDLLAFVIAEANLSVAHFAMTAALPCCGAAGHCFKTECHHAPVYATRARGHEPFGEARPPAADGRGARWVVKGKYKYELMENWRHAAALGCPGARFALTGKRYGEARLSIGETIETGGACARAERASYPPGEEERRNPPVQLVVRVPVPREARITPHLSGGLVAPLATAARGGAAPLRGGGGGRGRARRQLERGARRRFDGVAVPWFCPAHASGFWPADAGDGAPVAAAGFCAETAENDEGDCERGAQGGWAAGWASARGILTLADCVDACRRCARCNFVSLSFRPFHEECMWFHACPRFPRDLRTVPTAPDMVTVDVRLRRIRRG